MNPQLKSIIRHGLTALGTILALIGLDGVVPVITFLQSSLDQVWDAIIVIIGFLTTLAGFFTPKDRFNSENETPKT
jgi:phage-related protein